jgi:hypothetical protein
VKKHGKDLLFHKLGILLFKRIITSLQLSQGSRIQRHRLMDTEHLGECLVAGLKKCF